MRKLDNKSCEGLRLRVKTDSQESLKKPTGKTHDFSQLFMKLTTESRFRATCSCASALLHRNMRNGTAYSPRREVLHGYGPNRSEEDA